MTKYLLTGLFSGAIAFAAFSTVNATSAAEIAAAAGGQTTTSHRVKSCPKGYYISRRTGHCKKRRKPRGSYH